MTAKQTSKLSKRDRKTVILALDYAAEWAFSLIDAHQTQNGEDMKTYKSHLKTWRQEEKHFRKLLQKMSRTL